MGLLDEVRAEEQLHDPHLLARLDPDAAGRLARRAGYSEAQAAKFANDVRWQRMRAQDAV